jgi:thiol-disulfide isomerase/thioredoxin
MTKKIILVFLLAFIGNAHLFAHTGYHIALRMPDMSDQKVFLVHYYGTPGPKVYISDSATFDKNGVAYFNSEDPSFTGGIYMMLLGQKKKSFEFMLNNGDDIIINANESKLPEGITFKNSPENERFEEYLKFLKANGAKQEAYKKDLEGAKTADDTSAIRNKSIATNKELMEFRRKYADKYPGTVLAAIFKAMELPEIPEGPHYLEDGVTKDSVYPYRYYKRHYWDGFNFRDDRLIYTPLYDSKLDEYFNKWVQLSIDSMEKESDMLLEKTHGTKDMFHYTLWWLSQHFETSKVMGMDEVFVYIIEKYYMKGDATWLSTEELNKYIDRAQKISPNVIGNKGPEILLPNLKTGKEESLLDMKAKYTLVLFYSPNCGHCQHEIPLLDSAYNAVLKSKGVKVYTVATEGDEKTINDFITKYKIEDWSNHWDHEHVSDYHNKYDVYSTPVIYLLDENKIIKGKRLDHSNVGRMVEILDGEKKGKAK